MPDGSEISVRRVVAEVFAEHEDINDAKAALFAKCKADNIVMEMFARIGIGNSCREYFTDLRRGKPTCIGPGRIELAADDIQQRNSARVQRMEFWESYTLWGAVRLRYANKRAILASVQQRRVQAAGNLRRAKFEEAIGSRLKSEEDQVDGALTLNEVEKIAQEFKVVADERD